MSDRPTVKAGPASAPQPPGAALRLGAASVLGLALLTFSVAFFLPIYTDELGWKLVQARMHLDGGATVRTLPSCGPPGIPIPAPLLPARFVDALLYEGLSDPLVLRVAGFLLGLAQVGAAWLMLYRTQGPALGVWKSAVIIVAFATLGIMPFLLVMNRPEQILAPIIILTAMPLIFGTQPARRSLLADILLGTGLLLVFGFAIAEHPRGLFALPLMLLFVFGRIGARTVAWTAAAALSALAFVAFRNWGVRYDCADPGLYSIFVLDNVTTAIARGQLYFYLRSFIDVALDVPLTVLLIAQFQLRAEFTSDMIPGADGFAALGVAALTAASTLGLLLAGAAAFLMGLRAWRGDRRIGTPLLALAALWAIWGGSVVSRILKNDYEASVTMPVLVLAALGSIWVVRDRLAALFGPERWRRYVAGGFGALLVLSVLNQAVLIGTYVPHALGAWRQPGYAEGQRFSVVPFGYDGLRADILAAGALCGIDPASHPRHLVVDELTYYAFHTAYQPVLATYIDPRGWGRHIRDQGALLSRIGSQGMVTGCQWIPDGLRGQARQHGQFCCVPSFGQ